MKELLIVGDISGNSCIIKIMDEQQIANRLKENIPQPSETVVAPPAAPAEYPGPDRPQEYELNELVQYKLHDYFGEQYRETDETNRQQLSYIYEQIANMLEDPQYGFVIAKIREIERIIGTTNSDRRIYRLYQWLKLEGMRKNIDAQMEAVIHG